VEADPRNWPSERWWLGGCASLARQNGLSLVELLLGLSLSLLVVGVVIYGLQLMQKESTHQVRDVLSRNEYSVVSSHLKRFVSTGTLRFFGFSGKTPTSSPPDQTLARFLLPLPEKCADLSDCPGTTAFLYVNYDKTRINSLSAICSLNPFEIIVDLSNTTYGKAVAVPGGFQFAATADFPSETLTFGSRQLLGLVNPPFVTLWRPQTPTKLNSYRDSAGALVYEDATGAQMPLPSSCVEQLQGGDASALYRISIVPASLAQFSGGHQLWDATELAKSTGTFPLRIIPVNLRSMGRDIVIDPRTKEPKGQFAIKDCGFGSSGIECKGPNFLVASPFESLTIHLQFALTLDGRPGINSYELVKAGDKASTACEPSNCLPLPISNPINIPVILGNSESAEKLDPTGFSFLKMQYLQSIRFRLRLAGDRSEVIDVAIQ
jgi:hypothetical protein